MLRGCGEKTNRAQKTYLQDEGCSDERCGVLLEEKQARVLFSKIADVLLFSEFFCRHDEVATRGEHRVACSTLAAERPSSQWADKLLTSRKTPPTHRRFCWDRAELCVLRPKIEVSK